MSVIPSQLIVDLVITPSVAVIYAAGSTSAGADGVAPSATAVQQLML